MPGDIFRAPYPNPIHGISEEQSLNAIRTLFKTDIAPHRTAATHSHAPDDNHAPYGPAAPGRNPPRDKQ